jgi:pyrroline-5-carboxylate reductase
MCEENSSIQLVTEKIAFLGAGFIAEAWMERLLRSGSVAPEQVMACDIRPERLEHLQKSWGVCAHSDNLEGARFAQLIVLATPPPETLPVLRSLHGALRPDQVVISLAAAVPITALEQAAPNLPIVRVMPNTPALVGEAMNLVVFGSAVSKVERSRVAPLLDVLGKWQEAADNEVDLWCALCAVGPTFILPVIDALAAAAAARGLPPEKALQAAAQMVAGTAHMVQDSGRTPEQLKQMIGLRTLKEDDSRKLFTDAYNEAVQKLQAVGQKVAAARQ